MRKRESTSERGRSALAMAMVGHRTRWRIPSRPPIAIRGLRAPPRSSRQDRPTRSGLWRTSWVSDRITGLAGLRMVFLLVYLGDKSPAQRPILPLFVWAGSGHRAGLVQTGHWWRARAAGFGACRSRCGHRPKPIPLRARLPTWSGHLKPREPRASSRPIHGGAATPSITTRFL